MYDLIIVGAGPAGLTAALYAGRYRLNTLVLEKTSCGGQILLSPQIDNFPGFPGGISSEELISRFKQQVEALGLKIEAEEAVGLSVENASGQPLYTLRTADSSFQAKSIIIASGGRWKQLGVPGEQRLIGRGVSYCATCDAPFFRNKEIAVIGGGDRAVEESIFLAKYAAKVTLIHRRGQLRAARILEEKAKNEPRINFIFDSVVSEIIGENKVEGVKIKGVSGAGARELSCQGVFIFIGIAPNSGFAKGALATDESGFIITSDTMATDLAGVFACGDCRKKSLYQVINACGEAAVAAHSAHNYLLQTQ